MTFCLSALLWTTTAAALVLKSASQEGIAFKYHRGNKQRPGLCAELIELVQLKTNLHFSGLETNKTISKIMNDLSNKKIDVFFCSIKTPERTMIAEFIEPSLFSENLMVAVRASDPVSVSSWQELRSLKDNTILILNGTAYKSYLMQIPNLNIDDGATSVPANLKKLINNRGRFYIASEPSLRTEIAEMNLGKKVRLLPWNIRSQKQHIVVRKDLDPALKLSLSKTLQELRKTEEYKRILAKYNVSL